MQNHQLTWQQLQPRKNYTDSFFVLGMLILIVAASITFLI